MLRQFRIIAVVMLCNPVWAGSTDHAAALASLTPKAGHILHGVFPGGKTGAEDDITPADVDAYTSAVRHNPSWVYFSNNWYSDRRFPQATATWIRARGATPYVRLMLRSDAEHDKAEPVFTLAAIAGGEFDADFTAWGLAAAEFGTPILAEFGTEMNGDWFSWNAKWNGEETGAALFADAFRRIIDITRAAGADNIVWVFHANNGDYPDVDWNRLEAYYPGDEYIDWLAISVYSMQAPGDWDRTDFSASVSPIIKRFAQMAPDKPVIIAEFGTDVHNPRENAAQWADAALGDILGGRWSNLIGFSWWNETWENDDNPANDTDMRVQSDAGLAAVFQRRLSNAHVENGQ